MERFPTLPAGIARMKEELEWRKSVERPSISQQIEVAREHGDLKENAEYHAAKEKQGLAEGRIRLLESRIAMAQVVDPEKLSGNRISFGATVELLDVDEDKKLTYAIVGEEESDFRHGLLSYKSPIAQGILGKEEGDEVEVKTGAGPRTFEILDVRFEAIPLPPKKTWG
jgi:transcription elongation factor GreA